MAAAFWDWSQQGRPSDLAILVVLVLLVLVVLLAADPWKRGG